MTRDKTSGLIDAVDELESLEKSVTNLSLIFSEMLKDEINANDERKLYNGVKRIIRKYSAEKAVLSAIDEFTSVLSGGASLKEILIIAKDEAVNPTIASELAIDCNKCDNHK